MKNRIKLFGFIALVSVIGFSFTACGGDDSTTGGTAPTITTATLPNGVVGTPYSQTLAATGDTPITWSRELGSLPPGLTLSTSGVISGTPTTATGDYAYAFKVKATNTAGSNISEVLIITIYNPTIIISGTPKVGEKLTATTTGDGWTGNFEWTYWDSSIYGTNISSGISGQNNSELTIEASLEGKFITASHPHSSLPSGTSFSSNRIGPVQPAGSSGNNPTITISGTPKVGEKLTAATTGDGWSGNFVWGYSNSFNSYDGTVISSGISGQNDSELTIGTSLEGKYIYAMRSSQSTGSYSGSNMLGPVQTK
jgi:hypothetical protein